jgi:hypothetical protein
MPVSDNAILRQLKRHAWKQHKIEPLRAIAIDDWRWRKGFRLFHDVRNDRIIASPSVPFIV